MMTPAQRQRKTDWQRAKRTEDAKLAGRVPGTNGRPATGRKPRPPRGDRSTEYARRQSRTAPPWEPATTQHHLLDTATAIATTYISPDKRSTLHDPLFEEAVAEAVLALLVGADPEGAVVSVIKSERNRRHIQTPLLEE